MFRHLFRMIWNKKKQNFLLITEMLISFIVLFAVFTLLIFNYRNYRQPMAFEYDNVWAINFSNTLGDANKDSARLYFEILRNTIKSMPQIQDVSYTSENVPFSQSTIMNGFKNNDKQVQRVNWFEVEPDYDDVLALELTDGRWFDKRDIAYKTRPVVINTTLRKELFGDEKAVGRIIGDDNKMQIIGVVKDPKFFGDYSATEKSTFNMADSNSYNHVSKLLVKVKPGANAAFEGTLYKTVSNYLKSSTVEIEHLANKRKAINYFALVPMIVLSIVSAFLIINVALGLFGVLWYNINRRRGEIGLRRAVGATGPGVSGQMVAEALMLATLAIVIGTFFAVQFPLLNVFDLPAAVYLYAILFAVLFLYLLVFICSLYPGKQAAAIYPAVALHED
jgi:putative ABC transport system permease protein